MCLNCQWENLRERDSVHENSISLLLTTSSLTYLATSNKNNSSQILLQFERTHTTSKLFHIILLFQSIDMIISMMYET